MSYQQHSSVEVKWCGRNPFLTKFPDSILGESYRCITELTWECPPALSTTLEICGRYLLSTKCPDRGSEDISSFSPSSTRKVPQHSPQTFFLWVKDWEWQKFWCQGFGMCLLALHLPNLISLPWSSHDRFSFQAVDGTLVDKLVAHISSIIPIRMETFSLESIVITATSDIIIGVDLIEVGSNTLPSLWQPVSIDGLYVTSLQDLCIAKARAYVIWRWR